LAKQILTDESWKIIESVLLPARPKPRGGRPPVADRVALTGILFVLMTGIPCRWAYLQDDLMACVRM
jgi:transposase